MLGLRMSMVMEAPLWLWVALVSMLVMHTEYIGAEGR